MILPHLSIESLQVRDIHRRYYEKGEGARDVLIVAHGHFSRCLISRWLDQPLILGRSELSLSSLRPRLRFCTFAGFAMEPGGVSFYLLVRVGYLTAFSQDCNT
jgi:broad specificity phosphatase PhoE